MASLKRLIRRMSKKARLSFLPHSLPKIHLPSIQPSPSKIYSQEEPVDCTNLAFPGSQNCNSPAQLRSSLCTADQLASPAFRYWAHQLQEEFKMHRKLWEFCFIMQALYERNMLMPGRRGLGFAVGEEPLPSVMAKMGCSILASDLDAEDKRAKVWAATAQLASTLDGLNKRGLCDNKEFRKLVSFRAIDMNEIPPDVRDFDFTWSSCSFEHCGSLELGKRFIQNQMNCLKPGGVGVHTTEFNLSSLDDTIEEGTTVIFRRRDIEELITELANDGHKVETLQLDAGSSHEDSYIDLFPYSDNVHLKLQLFDRYVSTSVALIIQKSEAQSHSATKVA